MSWKHLCSQIDPACLKQSYTVDEYERVKDISIRINSTDLYKEYGGNLSYREFYAMLKQHLYYDKLICEHGIEFYYYVKFKKPRIEYIHDKDVLYTICAVGGKHV